MIDLRVRCRIEADHPAFAGHFPGRPLLPGVLLLAEVLEALGPQWPLCALTIEAAKFLSPVRPGDALDIVVQGEPQALRFEVRKGTVVAASGRLSLQLQT